VNDAIRANVAGGVTAAPTLVYRPASWVDGLTLEGMFGQPRPVEVELGSGDGSFLAQWAQMCPEVSFIGVERLLGRLRKLDRRGLRLGLRNLRLMRIEAGYFLQYLLPLRSVQAIHLYFPDPWPKRKQRKHRLVNDCFPELTARVLAAGGVVYLRTDDADYFAQMQEVFADDRRFETVATPERLATVATDFERGFNAQGIATRRAAYRLTVFE
jgi:tRNA (guanine-N7-)-methyltransferase